MKWVGIFMLDANKGKAYAWMIWGRIKMCPTLYRDASVKCGTDIVATFTTHRGAKHIGQ